MLSYIAWDGVDNCDHIEETRGHRKHGEYTQGWPGRSASLEGPRGALPRACDVLRCFSRVRLFVTLWTVARPAPLSREFSRQEHWSQLPCPPPGALPDPGIKPAFFTSPGWAGRFFTPSASWEACGGDGSVAKSWPTFL